MTLPENKKSTWLQTFLKVVFFVSAFVIVILTVFANIGGSSDALKQSIEQFASESTGYQAKVGKLHKMTFFPTISFDFENLDLSLPGGGTVVTVGRVYAAFGFFDVMMTNGKMKSILVKDLKALPGTLMKKSLSIENLGIVEDSEGSPRIEGNGTLGDQPVKISVDMKAAGKGRGRRYRFDKVRKFDFQMGTLRMKGDAENKEKPGMVVRNLEIKIDEKDIVKGMLDFSRNEIGEISLTGDLAMQEHHSDLTPHFEVDDPKSDFWLSGELASREFHVEDFAKDSGYDRFVSSFSDLFARDHAAETKNSDIDMTIENIYKGGSILGSYKGKAPIDNIGRFDTAEIVKKAAQAQP